MPSLYRVFPFDANAAPDEPGGALYVPPQGAGRIDNPSLYAVLYLSDAAQGAIAEAFGRFPEWTPAILAGSPALPGSVRAIAEYELSDNAAVCNLDDAKRLVSLKLRPSEVVTRNYTTTRGWAQAVYEKGEWAGVRWWSYYESQWGSVGLWKCDSLKLHGVRVLTLQDPDLVDASRIVVRRITGA